MQERKLDLKKCIDICRSTEATNSQLKTISAAQNEDVHGVKDKQQLPKRHFDRLKKNRKLEEISLEKHANFVVKFMFSKKASVLCLGPHVLNVKEEITWPQNATIKSTV